MAFTNPQDLLNGILSQFGPMSAPDTGDVATTEPTTGTPATSTSETPAASAPNAIAARKTKREGLKNLLGGFLANLGAGMSAAAQVGPEQAGMAGMGAAMQAPAARKQLEQQNAFKQAQLDAQERSTNALNALRSAQTTNIPVASKQRQEQIDNQYETAMSKINQAVETMNSNNKAHMDQLKTLIESKEKIAGEGNKNRLDVALIQTQNRNLNFESMYSKAFADENGRPMGTKDLADMAKLKQSAQGSFVVLKNDDGTVAGLYNPKSREFQNPPELASLRTTAVPFEAAKARENASSGLRAIQVLREELATDPNILYKSAIPGAPMSRTFETARSEAADVITRLRTGAALNQSEEGFYKRMLPTLLDASDPAAIEYKLSKLEELYSKFMSISREKPKAQASPTPAAQPTTPASSTASAAASVTEPISLKAVKPGTVADAEVQRQILSLAKQGGQDPAEITKQLGYAPFNTPKAPKVGDEKKFPNGKIGVWDGQGYVAK